MTDKPCMYTDEQIEKMNEPVDPKFFERPSDDYIATNLTLEQEMEDIFNPDVLCNECKKLGYCKRAANENQE